MVFMFISGPLLCGIALCDKRRLELFEYFASPSSCVGPWYADVIVIRAIAYSKGASKRGKSGPCRRRHTKTAGNCQGHGSERRKQRHEAGMPRRRGRTQVCVCCDGRGRR